jgi:hypothetical protein
MDKYDMIISAERQFAREVTLGVIVSRPPSVWHYIIPGMFIFDFLRRSIAIREYTRHFLFPRQLALEAAQHLLSGYDSASVDARIETGIENWLQSLSLHSRNLAEAQRETVLLLVDHYRRLLDVPGDSYPDLIQNAYRSGQKFQEHLQELTEAEKKVDKAVIEKTGENEKLIEKLKLEAQQVEMRRNKILEQVF